MLGKRGRPPSPGLLTPSEERVLELVREKRTNAEIAERLGISVNTVRFHVSHLLSKAGVESREELAAWQVPDSKPDRRWLAAPALKLVLGVGAVAVLVVAGGAVLASRDDETPPALNADEASPEASRADTDPTAPVLPRIRPDNYGEDSVGIGGTFVREGRCLYVDAQFNDHPTRFLLVFAPEVGWWDGEVGALVVDGLAYLPGSPAASVDNDPWQLPVSGAGGTLDDDPALWDVAPHHSCQFDRMTLVDDSDGDPSLPPQMGMFADWLPRYSLDATYRVSAESGHHNAKLEVAGNCVYLLPQQADSERWLIAFPAYGDWWDESTEELVLFSTRYRAGEVVPLDGLGTGFLDDPGEASYWEVEPGDDCDRTTVFPLDPWAAERVVNVARRGGGGTISHAEAARREYLSTPAYEVMTALAGAIPGRLNSVCWDASGEFKIVATYTGGEEGLDDALAIADGSPVEVEVRSGATKTAEDLVHIVNDAFILAPPEARAEFWLRCDHIEGTLYPGSSYAGRPEELAEMLATAYGVKFVIEDAPD